MERFGNLGMPNRGRGRNTREAKEVSRLIEKYQQLFNRLKLVSQP